MTSNDLKSWRARMGWTQAQAAEKIGIQTRQYQRLETGVTGIKPLYQTICDALEDGRAKA